MAKEYTIQEASEMTRVSSHTLRFYERIGLLEVARADNGHRRYSEEDLGWVRFVLLLRGTNMPLSQIEQFMQLEKDGHTTMDERRHMLESHRDELVQHVNELLDYLRALDAKIAYYENSPENCEYVSNDEEDSNGVSPTGANGASSESLVHRVNELRQFDGQG